MKCFFLTWSHTKSNATVAFTNVKVGTSFEVIKEVINDSVLYFDFNIKDVLETKSGLIINEPFIDHKYDWLDYLPNNLAWPLMSEKMKYIIEKNLIERDYISWISTNVTLFEEQRSYYVLKFNKQLDVLNFDKTMYVLGTDLIIKPVFSKAKISNYAIFSVPSGDDLWRITHRLNVSENLKKSLQKGKCTGLVFSEASTG